MQVVLVRRRIRNPRVSVASRVDDWVRSALGQTRQTEIREQVTNLLARVVDEDVSEVQVVVSKLGVLGVNLLERRNNLANQIRHHLVGDATTHLTQPALQGSAVRVLGVHDHLLVVIEDARTSVRKFRHWDEAIMVEKLDWFRDVSRGNLIKSLLDVVFDASHLFRSRKLPVSG